MDFLRGRFRVARLIRHRRPATACRYGGRPARKRLTTFFEPQFFIADPVSGVPGEYYAYLNFF